MKVGDLVKNRRTGDIGMVINIRSADLVRYGGTDKLDLLRCLAHGGHYFEARRRSLEVVSESR